MPEVAQNTLGPPELPGCVAVSVNALDGAFDPRTAGSTTFAQAKPVAEIGGARKVYRIERWW